MKPTLLILAAGMGSRYGGLKQMDAVGPGGETIMDYSIFDAARAGFGKVVFVIRKDFETAFRDVFEKRFGSAIEVDFVLQAIDKVPQGYAYNTERTKPWGTNHAVMMGASAIHEPFAVINADDFYGKESFYILAKFLSEVDGKKNLYAMVGYRLSNTLSNSGAVSRGICEKSDDDLLASVVERTHIERLGGKPSYKDANGIFNTLDKDVPVSMNMWAFTPEYFEYSDYYFKEFLKENGQNPKSEFFIPYVIDKLIQSGTAKVKVLDTSAKWFGVTYAEDKPTVIMKINELVNKGVYPDSLWKIK
ncbi:MAG: nucleotidyltransferase [Prevotellaceae bacterium]|jgi:UTP-glucose-1-phosphate uridylyltransferase|nr:nucleotidyltransferase [Prevotellaceae bacterium]